MPRAERIIPDLYRDSVALMELSARVSSRPGVKQAVAVMATAANIALLAEAGMLGERPAPRPNDILVAVEGDDEAAIAAALAAIEEGLRGSAGTGAADAQTQAIRPASLAMGLDELPTANFALISTPGEYAAAEAEKALRLGLHVMVFSDQVPIADEIALKRRARDAGLFMMGPDCGTAIVDGVPLGFANVVRRGPVGVIGASGTGLQQVTCLLDRAQVGISQAIGTGSHDLSEAVGGITMLHGLAALAADPDTRVIVLVSKPPAPTVAATIREAAAKAGKPVVINFLGAQWQADTAGLHAAETLEEAAVLAAALARGEPAASALARLRETPAGGPEERIPDGGRYVRGLFSGGTFCYEAQVILSARVSDIWSNAPIESAGRLPDPWRSRAHTLLDLGDDVFTRGRPHPMIDQRLRIERLLAEADDPDTAVILFDLVLGHGGHHDPAPELAAAILSAREKNGRATRPAFVASVCGTAGDPQDLARQENVLREAGVLLAPSNAAASRLAGRLVERQREDGR